MPNSSCRPHDLCASWRHCVCVPCSNFLCAYIYIIGFRGDVVVPPPSTVPTHCPESCVSVRSCLRGWSRQVLVLGLHFVSRLPHLPWPFFLRMPFFCVCACFQCMWTAECMLCQSFELPTLSRVSGARQIDSFSKS